MKNPDDCGGLVELAIRKFLREVVGERFQITHGYIYSSKNKKLSPQIDIIITDKLVSHSLKRFDYLDNLEIVPVEAVVAIFEVKRTLRTASLTAAADHLEKIFYEVPVLKDNTGKYLPGGMRLESKNNITIDGGKFSNPLIGIIGLLHEEPNNCTKLPWFVDTVFSFQGYLRAPKNTEDDSLWVFSTRSSKDKIEFKEFSEKNEEGQVRLLKVYIAYLLAHLDSVSGRAFDLNAYFS